MNDKYLLILVISILISICSGAKNNGNKGPKKGVIKPNAKNTKYSNTPNKGWRHDYNAARDAGLAEVPGKEAGYVLYIMLNPGAAVRGTTDQTTRKLQHITQVENNFQNYKIRNLFAAMTVHPTELIHWLNKEKTSRTKLIQRDNESKNAVDSRGWKADLKNAKRIVLAWGGDGSKPAIRARRDEVLQYLEDNYGTNLYYMATTADDDPRHPAILPYADSRFKLWSTRPRRG
jgi:hypothetical protein